MEFICMLVCTNYKNTDYSVEKKYEMPFCPDIEYNAYSKFLNSFIMNPSKYLKETLPVSDNIKMIVKIVNDFKEYAKEQNTNFKEDVEQNEKEKRFLKEFNGIFEQEVGEIGHYNCDKTDYEYLLNLCKRAFFTSVPDNIHEIHNLLLALPDRIFKDIISRVISTPKSINCYILTDLLNEKELLYHYSFPEKNKRKGVRLSLDTSQIKYYSLHQQEDSDTISQIQKIPKHLIVSKYYIKEHKDLYYFLYKLLSEVVSLNQEKGIKDPFYGIMAYLNNENNVFGSSNLFLRLFIVPGTISDTKIMSCYNVSKLLKNHNMISAIGMYVVDALKLVKEAIIDQVSCKLQAQVPVRSISEFQIPLSN